MKKFIITVDTPWCGTGQIYKAIAEQESDLWDAAGEAAYENFQSYNFDDEIFADLGYDMEDLSEERIAEIWETEVDESQYYDWNIEEYDKNKHGEWEEIWDLV